MRRLFALTVSILIALSMILPQAGAMSNTDKDKLAMALERTLMDRHGCGINFI